MFKVTPPGAGSPHSGADRAQSNALRKARLGPDPNKEIRQNPPPKPTRSDENEKRIEDRDKYRLARRVAEQIRAEVESAAQVKLVRAEDEVLGRLLDLRV